MFVFMFSIMIIVTISILNDDNYEIYIIIPR